MPPPPIAPPDPETEADPQPATGADRPPRSPADRRPRRGRGALQKWSRLIHVYSSMIVLLLVLFFGVTGITLNHPGWTFGFPPSTSTSAGAIPTTALTSDGRIELLALSEYLRHHAGVSGEISEFGLNATNGYLSYRGPGYAADVTIDVPAKTYKVEVEKQGLLGVMNDLHKGRSTSVLWGHVIDVAGAVLVVTALAGLLLQLALRRRRTAAMVVAALGGALATWIAITTLA